MLFVTVRVISNGAFLAMTALRSFLAVDWSTEYGAVLPARRERSAESIY